jgi:CelD/BcsL family acetyltransferase involved in cellulose biosynthesis
LTLNGNLIAPRTVLFYETIKEAFSNNYREFDFLRGNEGYKSRWTQNHRMLYAATIYNKTIRANLSKTFSKSKDFVKRNLKTIN